VQYVHQVRKSPVIVAAIVTAGAWVYVIRSAGSTSSAMPMPGGWSMSMACTGNQSGRHATTFLVMWTAMMIAMMLPSVMPTVLLHRRLIETRVERGDRSAGSHLLLLAGYFSVWVAFGAVAYAIGMTLAGAAMRSIRVSVLVPVATGLALAAAGAYQLTQWSKSAASRRSPSISYGTRFAGPVIRRSRYHGVCAVLLGLMVIQLALGVMSVPLMALVAPSFCSKTVAHGEGWRGRRRASPTGGILALRATSRVTRTPWRIAARKPNVQLRMGCPCQFNALSRTGVARRSAAHREGHYGRRSGRRTATAQARGCSRGQRYHVAGHRRDG
jgi:predicted metal-binding membrane protein